MGNAGSNHRRHHHYHHHPPPHPPPPPPTATTNHYIVTAPPTQYPNPNLPYSGYHPPPPLPAFLYGGLHRYPYNAVPPPPLVSYVDHQKAVTIKNDVNVKKETIRVEEDEENPGKFLVCFTFDATAPGRITILFFAKEGVDCNMIATKENMFKPVTVPFEQGLGQKFRQPSGTGVDFSIFEESELTKVSENGVYPLVATAEACPPSNDGEEASPSNAEKSESKTIGNSQITLATINKDKGVYQVRVMKQILWVNDNKYELHEIYGISDTVNAESDGNDSGKECVICMSEPRDTTVLPCRHMCMCNGCAKVLQFQTNRCPICRQPVDGLLEIKVTEGTDN